MKNIIATLIKQSTIYSIGSASLQLANFLLVPLYAKYLTPDEFGIQALFIILITMMIFCIDLGIKTSINRIYYDYTSSEDKKKLLGNAFIFTNIFGLLIVFLILAFKSQVLWLLIGKSNYLIIVYYVVWDVFFQATLRLFLDILRLKNSPVLFVIVSIAKLLSVLVLVIYFVAYQNEGLIGVFKGNFISSLIIYLAILPFVFKYIKLSVNCTMLKEMIVFGLPFVPANIFSFILTSSDRYILKAYSNLEEVGLYSMGYRIGLVVYVFVVQPFVLAWPQKIVPISESDNHAETFKHIVTYFVGIAGFLITMLLVFLHELYALFLTPDFYASKRIVPFVAASYLFYGLYYIFLIGIFLEKKTKYPPLIVAFAATLNVCVNVFYAIPKWGMLGAAVTTLLAYLIIPIITLRISNRYYKLEIEYFRIFKLIAIFTLIIIIAKFATFDNIIITSITKLSIIAAGISLLFAINFFNVKEKLLLNKFFNHCKNTII